MFNVELIFDIFLEETGRKTGHTLKDFKVWCTDKKLLTYSQKINFDSIVEPIKDRLDPNEYECANCDGTGLEPINHIGHQIYGMLEYDCTVCEGDGLITTKIKNSLLF